MTSNSSRRRLKITAQLLKGLPASGMQTEELACGTEGAAEEVWDLCKHVRDLDLLTHVYLLLCNFVIQYLT